MNIVNKITTYQNRNAGKNAQIIAHNYGLRGGNQSHAAISDLRLRMYRCITTETPASPEGI